MTEHGMKFVPVTYNVNAPDPAIALVGVRGLGLEVVVGAGEVAAATVKFTALESADPFETVMGNDPGVIASV
jgi:2-keto-3-deoxy-6-phosphogluconate aldolase